MIGRLLCKLGRHRWRDEGLAEQARGRLERCSRPTCASGVNGGPATRRVEVPFSVVEDEIYRENCRLWRRPRPRKKTQSDADLEQEVLDVEDMDTDLIGLPAGATCPACKKPIYSFHVSRCPRCGAPSPKKEN